MHHLAGKSDKILKDKFRQNVLQQVPQGEQPPPQLQQQADEVSRNLLTALQSDRKNLMGGDLLRSIFLMAITFVIIALFIKKENFTRYSYSFPNYTKRI